jgi:hypothetical protein
MITREYLAQYIRLKQNIEDTQKKIAYYQCFMPRVEYGKVYGSDSNFPYTKRSFTISGYNGPTDDGRYEKIRKLQIKLSGDLKKYEDQKLEIELFISEIPDLTTKLIFSYTYIDGMRQEDVARKLYMEQSSISKRISRYLDTTNLQVSYNS